MSCQILFVLIFIQAIQAEEERLPLSASNPQFWGSLVTVIFLVLLSGLLAGLTLGLMSLDEFNLYILSVAGTKKEKIYASHLLPIRKNGHLLLTCLVLTNTVINETLPIILDGIFGKGYIAVVVSTVLIVLFSEIIPQAICSKHGLALGSFFYIPIKILIGLWFIIAWPISKILECMIGSHRGTIYTPQGLSELVNIHSADKNYGGKIDVNTVHLIKKSLQFQVETAGQKANYQDSLMIPCDKILDADMISDILKTGFSHIFVYNNKNDNNKNDIKLDQIIGVFDTKVLLCYNVSVLVSDIPLDSIETNVKNDQSVMDVFTLLVKSSSKFCLLSDTKDNNSTLVEMTFLEKETKAEKKQYAFGQVASINQLSLAHLMAEFVN